MSTDRSPLTSPARTERQIAHGAVKLLCLGGQARSGSTLLDRALGQVDGVCSAGEVRYLWDRGLREDQRCGCGEPLRSCPFWVAVGEAAFGGWSSIDLDEVLALRNRVDGVASLPKLLAPRGRFRASLQRYAAYLERVYLAIAEVSGAGVVVDSSMSPPHGLVLRHVGSVDLRCVHLIRDPRGVAFSSGKTVERPEIVRGSTEFMPTYSAVESSLRWNAANLTYEGLGYWVPTTRVRYESFVRDPRTTIRSIGRHLGLEWSDDQMRHIGHGSIELGIDHTAAGNPMRFETGTLPLRLDEAWRRGMVAGDRRRVSALTWPFLRRYGFQQDESA